MRGLVLILLLLIPIGPLASPAAQSAPTTQRIYLPQISLARPAPRPRRASAPGTR